MLSESRLVRRNSCSKCQVSFLSGNSITNTGPVQKYRPRGYLLKDLFAELYAADQMEMQVHHGLTAVLAAVVDNAVAV